MNLLHATWFWIVIIIAPIAGLVGTLARLAHREPPASERHPGDCADKTAQPSESPKLEDPK